jgi:hypothetical protein
MAGRDPQGPDETCLRAQRGGGEKVGVRAAADTGDHLSDRRAEQYAGDERAEADQLVLAQDHRAQARHGEPGEYSGHGRAHRRRRYTA